MAYYTESFDGIIRSSIPLKSKTKQILDLFENTLDSIVLSNTTHPYFFKILKFFSDNSNVEDEFLLSGLNRFFIFITQIEHKLFPIINIDEFRDCLKENQNSMLFQKSSQYWSRFYLAMKEKENDLEEEKEICSIFNGISYEEKLLATKSLLILQKAHDSFEKYQCCSKNKKFLQFYLNELLIVSNSMIDQEKLNDKNSPDFTLIIENTKVEIIRLLKCLFGMDFQSRPCNHSPSSSNVQNLNRQLVERILEFYLPKEKDLIEEEIDEKIVEMCEKLYPSFEHLLTKELKNEFEKYFTGLRNYFPTDNLFNNEEMEDLIPNKKVNQTIVSNISDESRLIFAKACYILTQKSFDEELSTNTLNLTKETLMFGQDILNKKLVGKVWYIIAKCLRENVKPEQTTNSTNNNQETDTSTESIDQCNDVQSSSSSSSLHNSQTEIETQLFSFNQGNEDEKALEQLYFSMQNIIKRDKVQYDLKLKLAEKTNEELEAKNKELQSKLNKATKEATKLRQDLNDKLDQEEKEREFYARKRQMLKEEEQLLTKHSRYNTGSSK